MSSNSINYFGQIHFRGKNDPFGIKPEDRSRHMYVIGKTGMGKTALLQNMAIQDVVNGRGLGIIDPHGDFAERVMDFVPEHRIKDVIYLNPADSDFPIGLNLLEDVGYDKRHLVASGLMGVFKKIWVDVWSARMEYILNNAILALMEYPDATLLDVNRMMTNKEFRNEVLSHVKDPIVREFWLEQFVNWGERLAGEATAAIENKVGQFTAAPLIRNIIGQKQSTIDLRKLMDEGKILIVNLSKGYIGEENSRLLGAMTITKLYLAAMSRVDIPESERSNFVLYVDEFQNFASEAFEGILSEARKYGLSLVLAHQYIEQMDETVRAAVFGNIGTFVAFRVGAADAEYIEKEFTPTFVLEDLVNLGKHHIILRLMIDGVTSPPFSATTLPPLVPSHESYRDTIIQTSRSQWTIPREEIEAVIRSRLSHLEEVPNDTTPRPNSYGPPKKKKDPKEPSVGSDGSTLYNAKCDNCGRDTRVVFEPDGSRPVYCKKCRKKGTNGNGAAKQQETQELVREPQVAPLSLAEAMEKYPSVQKEPKQHTAPAVAPKRGERAPKQRKEIDVEGLRALLEEANNPGDSHS